MRMLELLSAIAIGTPAIDTKTLIRNLCRNGPFCPQPLGFLASIGTCNRQKLHNLPDRQYPADPPAAAAADIPAG